MSGNREEAFCQLRPGESIPSIAAVSPAPTPTTKEAADTARCHLQAVWELTHDSSWPSSPPLLLPPPLPLQRVYERKEGLGHSDPYPSDSRTL